MIETLNFLSRKPSFFFCFCFNILKDDLVFFFQFLFDFFKYGSGIENFYSEKYPFKNHLSIVFHESEKIVNAQLSNSGLVTHSWQNVVHISLLFIFSFILHRSVYEREEIIKITDEISRLLVLLSV